MEFPTLLYRCPGMHQCEGGSFSTLQVQDDKESATALKAGWCETLPEAMGIAPPPSKAPRQRRAATPDSGEDNGANEDGLV